MNANDKFIAFNEQAAMVALSEYGFGVMVWDKFWQFMRTQSELGAPFSYVEECTKVLELAWSKEKNEHRFK